MKEKFIVRFMAGVCPFHWSPFASNQGALNALLLLLEFIVHLPLTVDIVTADSSEKNLKDTFLCTTKCTWRRTPWVECIHTNRCRGPCILTHEEKTGDSDCTLLFFRLTTLRSSK